MCPSAQRTAASSRVLPGLEGAMAVTVPQANGPALVGAAGPLSIASDCRELLEKRTVSPFCRATLTKIQTGIVRGSTLIGNIRVLSCGQALP